MIDNYEEIRERLAVGRWSIVPLKYVFLLMCGLVISSLPQLPDWARLAGQILFYLMLVVVVAYIVFWCVEQVIRSIGKFHESQAITPELVSMRELNRMEPRKFEYLAKRGMLTNVQVGFGPVITWYLDGQNIPFDFVSEWYEKYQAKGGAKLLPSEHDFNSSENRDQKRAWYKHVNAVLKREGYIDDPGGPIPAQFIVAPDLALSRIGMLVVLSIIEMLKEGES